MLMNRLKYSHNVHVHLQLITFWIELHSSWLPQLIKLSQHKHSRNSLSVRDIELKSDVVEAVTHKQYKLQAQMHFTRYCNIA